MLGELQIDYIFWLPCLKSPGVGYSRQNCTWVGLPNLEKWTFSIQFLPITHPSVYPFRQKNTQFCSNWVLFTMICSKYTQFLNLGPFVSDENPSIAKPNCTKKRQKARNTYVYQVNVRTPTRWKEMTFLIWNIVALYFWIWTMTLKWIWRFAILIYVQTMTVLSYSSIFKLKLLTT